MTGTLYVIATPLGNLGDMSPRAIEVLNAVDKVLAEDTRHSGRLLQHFGVNKPLVALHDHNEEQQSRKLLAELKEGSDFAVISDAGTPLISDPGYRLVNLAQKEGITVSPIPGPCAVVAALSALGLPCQEFVFMGFLPAKASKREKVLQEWVSNARTVVFYEAPHRIREALEACMAVLGGDRLAGMARELTKTHETLRVGTLSELCEWVSSDPDQQRGELVLVLTGAPEPETADAGEMTKVLGVLLEELPLNQASRLCSKLTGIPKNEVYSYALSLQK